MITQVTGITNDENQLPEGLVYDDDFVVWRLFNWLRLSYNCLNWMFSMVANGKNCDLKKADR